MTAYQDKLSAYLDGELPEEEAREIELALEDDPALQAELEELMAADTWAKDQFAVMASEPIPFKLATAIQDAKIAPPAPLETPKVQRTGWLIAAGLALALVAGGTGGYFVGASQDTQLASAPTWLQDIAEYHAVYAGQSRHLVEVPAEEKDHIEAWLTKTLGDAVAVPDLMAQGLEFQGARLLVAAGKPVAQLMYRDGENRIVALCQIQTATPRDGFGETTLGAFQMVSWGGGQSNFVIVGDEGRGDLSEIAKAASVQL